IGPNGFGTKPFRSSPGGFFYVPRIDIAAKLNLGSGAGEGVRSQIQGDCAGVQFHMMSCRVDATVIETDRNLVISRKFNIKCPLIPNGGHTVKPLITDGPGDRIRRLYPQHRIEIVTVDNRFVDGEWYRHFIFVDAQGLRHKTSAVKLDRQTDLPGIVYVKSVTYAGL